MSNSWAHTIKQLQIILGKFDEEHTAQKLACLQSIRSSKINKINEIITYHELLLFMITHPDNKAIYLLAYNELKRLALHLKKMPLSKKQTLDDHGLPFTSMCTRFSHDAFFWLSQQHDVQLCFDSFANQATPLNELLKFTLPSVERDETSAGLSNDELLDALQVSKNKRLEFLLQQFSTIEHKPLLKDYLWDSLKAFVTIRATKLSYSRSFNKLPHKSIYFQSSILKNFDYRALIDSPLPKPESCDKNQLEIVSAVIRKSMLLTMRETDPATYINVKTIRLYSLERGISVAIYGMDAERLLPLQSYIGYTLFKNGYPIAYGGTWVFGKTARFGLNIFEAFRGGESGYIMCQLLRVYKQTFTLSNIEVDAHQFGKDNPDGIRSGAYWFYYRYGFRSIDPEIKFLAEKEAKKIANKKGYRSSEKTLIQLAESDISLTFSDEHSPSFVEINLHITNLIRKTFKGDRTLAVKTCIAEFCVASKLSTSEQLKHKSALEEIALLSKALHKHDTKSISLLLTMLSTKENDPYRYNKMLMQLLH